MLFTLAVPLAAPVIAVAAFAAGVGIEVFEVDWATAMQQEIPPAALSRVSSYDAMGSWGLAPSARWWLGRWPSPWAPG